MRAEVVWIVFVCSACGGAGTRTSQEPSKMTRTIDVAGAVGSAESERCVEADVGSPDRERAIDLFLADRPDEALAAFDAVVRANPRDRAAEAFLEASEKKIAAGRANATAETREIPAVALEPLPLTATSRSNVAVPGAAVQLEKVSESKNLITDTADWETKNALPAIVHRGAVDAPKNVPPKLQRQRLLTWIAHPDHTVAIYERAVLVTAPGRRTLVFDATEAQARAPVTLSVTFAQVVGTTLVATLAYNGYANASGGKNGFVAAFDTKAGTLAWVSEPLVANAWEAIVSGKSIVTGYGFTAEPDFLFAIDLATGKVTQKIPVKSGPELLRLKGDRLFVRTYDRDYVFKSTTGFAPAAPADLPPSAGPEAPQVSAAARCWLRRATAAISARDPNALRDAADHLRPLSNDRGLSEMLTIAEERLRMKGRLDLWAAPLTVVAAPPWEERRGPPSSKTGKKLVRRSAQSAPPDRGMRSMRVPQVFDPTRPFFLAPADEGRLPDGARPDIPSRYGRELLSAILPGQRGKTMLVYGGRYLVMIEGDSAERTFDLDAFRRPPKVNPQWKEFSLEDLSFADERDGTLYLCNGGGSYAREVFHKKGFLSAVDAKTGALVWRSAPLVCNATFVIDDDAIISGYGFTDEPDFVFLIRRADGAIEQKTPIASGPEDITLRGRRVHVESYAHAADFDIVVVR
jgi:hypothetical protein